MTPKDKALNTILSLRRLAEHPNTPPHEAEAARGRIAALKQRHGITPATDPTDVDFADKLKAAAKAAHEASEKLRKFNEQQARLAKAAEEARLRVEAWKRRNANRDSNGVLFTPSGDPLEDAIRRDGRTHAQKQADMNRAMGHQEGECSFPETFYDSGGMARKRNAYEATCDRCRSRLHPGEGAVITVFGRSVVRCCEMAPGPRRKRRPTY